MRRHVERDLLHRPERAVVEAHVLEADDRRRAARRSIDGSASPSRRGPRSNPCRPGAVTVAAGRPSRSWSCGPLVRGRFEQVGAFIRSPLLVVPIAEDDREGVGDDRDGEQDHDRCRRERPEFLLRLACPVEDDRRQRRVRPVSSPRRAAGRERPQDRPDQDEWRRFTDARDKARTVPVRMPGAAAGRISLRTTCQRDAPSPNPASRRAIGHRPDRFCRGDDDQGRMRTAASIHR